MQLLITKVLSGDPIPVFERVCLCKDQDASQVIAAGWKTGDCVCIHQAHLMFCRLIRLEERYVQEAGGNVLHAIVREIPFPAFWDKLVQQNSSGS